MSDLLLLSGGMDSAALAAWKRPAGCLFVDYGQRPASGEARSAAAVARALGLVLHTITADCSAVGTGVLGRHEQPDAAPTPEWWPFRNQLLVTIAAAYAVAHDYGTVLIATVKDDGERHADGTATFVESLDRLLCLQEGGIGLTAPALHLTTAELIAESGIEDAALGWTHSCHFSSTACGGCPGCRRRAAVLSALGRLQ